MPVPPAVLAPECARPRLLPASTPPILKRLTSGVRDILRNGSGPDASEQWARDCCGSAFCLDVCEHGINPRFMLAMARRALANQIPAAERKQSGKEAFKTMSRGVKTLTRLQLEPEQLARLSPAARQGEDNFEPPDLIFYTGCNLLKTPHIGLLCLDVLDRLEVTYDVLGGPANCCGIFQARAGDMENAGRQAYRTLDRFAQAKASQILSWCPTCQIQFGEVTIPGYERSDGDHMDRSGAGIDMTMLPIYLAQNLDRLRPMMTRPVNRKVALHEYPGAKGVTESVMGAA